MIDRQVPMTRKRQNPKGRRKPRMTESGERVIWLFGLHAVDAALRNPGRVKHRLVLTRNAAAKLREAIAVSGMRHEEVDPRRFRVPIDSGSVHQGAALEASPLLQRSLDSVVKDCRPGSPLIVLDRVTDPHNVGAIIRSAGAFGAAGVIAPARHSPPETGALAKSSSGAIENVPYVRIGNLAAAMEFMQGSGVLLAGFDPIAEASLRFGGRIVRGTPGRTCARVRRRRAARPNKGDLRPAPAHRSQVRAGVIERIECRRHCPARICVHGWAGLNTSRRFLEIRCRIFRRDGLGRLAGPAEPWQN